jgi:hypothetical protein
MLSLKHGLCCRRAGVPGKKPGKQRGPNKEVTLTDISRDTGCKGVSTSCLACPLPACLYDVPVSQRAAYRAKFLPASTARGGKPATPTRVG